MLATIVVVVISLVLIAIALVVFFRWRSSTSHVRMRNKMGVRSCLLYTSDAADEL